MRSKKFIILLMAQIAGLLLLAFYTVWGQAEVWRMGHELALLRHRHSRELEKSHVLEVLLTRARTPGELGDKAEQMSIVLAQPSREVARPPAKSESSGRSVAQQVASGPKRTLRRKPDRRF